MKDTIKNILNNSINIKQQILSDDKLISEIENISNVIIKAYQIGNKVLLCGNGGSAADAQHIAAELSNKFYIKRKPLDAEALHVNTSYLTAAANDYNFDEVYSRQILGKAKSGDVLIAISTSGNSQNVINAIQTANELQLISIGLSGLDGGKMNKICKYMINVPSNDTARIQECHITIAHIICQIVEEKLFQNNIR